MTPGHQLPPFPPNRAIKDGALPHDSMMQAWKLLCLSVLVGGLLLWALIISAGIWVVQHYVTWGVVYIALAIAAFGIGVFLFSERMAISALRAESRERGKR